MPSIPAGSLELLPGRCYFPPVPYQFDFQEIPDRCKPK